MPVIKQPTTFEQPGRIDIWKVPDGIRVMKWRWDWKRGDRPVINYVNTKVSFEEACQHLRNNGWIVRTWASGARAWNGQSQFRPIRTKSQIIAKRSRMTRNKNLHPGLSLVAADFAFEW